ncbi:hypothetical protein SRHO_G00045070 [Serrasalmus rhombeus]
MRRLPTGNGQSRCVELRPLAAASSWDPVLTCAFRGVQGAVCDAQPCIHHGARGPVAPAARASFPNAGARAEQQVPYYCVQKSN